jgi:LPXTG-site transpeptidase (sortase) family protein
MKLLGYLLFLTGFIILLLIFGPILKDYLQYEIDQITKTKYSLDVKPEDQTTNLKAITPVDTSFGIVIPKIDVNEKIFAEVDPTNPNIYLPILKKGVAHSKGSGYPNKPGNVFLFAHSSDAFYNVAQYNAVFFLIGKLEKGDEIDVFYKDIRYIYKVVSKIVVTPEGLADYVKKNTDENSLTLQTCYPPGTSLNRLIVIAKK